MTQAQLPTATESIVLAETGAGALVLDAAELYLAPTGQAWEYLQDMHRIYAGGVPNVSGYDLTPDQAQQHFSNGLTCAMGQMLALDQAGNLALAQSVFDYVGQAQSMDGLESVFLSGVMTAIDASDSALLQHARDVWDAVGGLPDLLGGGADVMALLDTGARHFGFPTFGELQQIVSDPVGAATAPGHHLFDKLSGLVGAIDSGAGKEFEQFRHSAVGQFVEGAVGVAMTVFHFVEGPLAKGVEAAVEGGIDLLKDGIHLIGNLVHAVFGSDDKPTPEQERQHQEAAQHTRDGSYVPVGAQRKGGSHDHAADDGEGGICPPDFEFGPQRPPLDGQAPWPTRPQPMFGGDGLGELLRISEDGVVEIEELITANLAIVEELHTEQLAEVLALAEAQPGVRGPERSYRLPTGEASWLEVSLGGPDGELVIGHRRGEAYESVLRCAVTSGNALVTSVERAHVAVDAAAVRAATVDAGAVEELPTFSALVARATADLAAAGHS